MLLWSPFADTGIQGVTKAPNDYVVWGAGGHGRVVADLIRAVGGHVTAWITAHPEDDDARRAGADGTPVIAAAQWTKWRATTLASGRSCSVVPAVGRNAVRHELVATLGDLLADAIVHPTAVVSRSAVLGPGTVVMPQAVINAGAVLGQGVIVNTAAIVEHDCRLGDAVHLSPGAVLAGGVTVFARAWIGAAAVVLQGRCISEDVTVGAGAVVIDNVPAGMTVAGNPARRLQEG